MDLPVFPGNVVCQKSLDEVPQLDVLEPLPADAFGVAGVVGELDRVDGVDLVAEELEGEGGALVAHVAGHDVALDREDAAVCVGHVQPPMICCEIMNDDVDVTSLTGASKTLLSKYNSM